MTLGCRPNTSNDDSRRSIWRFLQAELPRAICQGRTHIIHAIFVGFQRWLDDKAARLSPGTRMEGGTNYPQRGLVAAYIADHLQPFLDSGRTRHIRARALSVEKDASFRITLADASTVKADQPVIAASHPPPSIPEVLVPLAASPRLIADPSQAERISALAHKARRIAIIGTGLTAVDVIASLDRQGFRGEVLAVSYPGLAVARTCAWLRRKHGRFCQRSRNNRIGPAAPHPGGGAAQSLRWQATLGRVRKQAPGIWAALPLTKRRKLLRRLRVWWDVHRFRIAPQVKMVQDRLAQQGKLTVATGHLQGADEGPEGIRLDWRPKGQPGRRDRFDAVILTTGPAHHAILTSSDLLAVLADAGLIRPDPLQLGLDVTERRLAVGADGKAVGNLYVAGLYVAGLYVTGLYVTGPLARGHIGKLMGVPEVTAHAELVAARVAQQMVPSTAPRCLAPDPAHRHRPPPAPYRAKGRWISA